MYRMKITGAKKAVLMTWASALGYGGPDVQYESGDDDDYTIVCEIETRNDADPFGGDEDWNGEKLSLDSLSEYEIRDMECNSELVGKGAKVITGCLGVDLMIVNLPDDWDNPEISFYHYQNGKLLSSDYIDDDPDVDGLDLAEAFFEGNLLFPDHSDEGEDDYDDDEDSDDAYDEEDYED